MSELTQSVPFLDPIDRAFMVKLIDTIVILAHRMEARLPHAVMIKHWQKAKSSPSPWQALYWEHLHPTAESSIFLNSEELEALSLRATLADVYAQLQTVWTQVEASTKPAPDLTLRRQKRVEL